VTTPTRGRRGSRIGPSRGHDGLHGGGLVPTVTSRSRRRRRKKEKSSGRGKKEKEKERLILPPLPFDHGTCSLPSHFQLRELSWEREFNGYYPRLKYSPFCPVNPFEISAPFEALGGNHPRDPSISTEASCCLIDAIAQSAQIPSGPFYRHRRTHTHTGPAGGTSSCILHRASISVLLSSAVDTVHNAFGLQQ